MSEQAIQSLQQLSRALVWIAGALLAYGLGSWLLAQPFFALRHVEVAAPVAHVTAAQVKLVTDRHVRGNYFTVDLAQLQHAFEKLPWVREARVTRRWPDALVVSFAEHVPLARWNDAALVNQQGEVFAAALDAPLPQLAGPLHSSGEVTRAYLAHQQQLAKIGRSVAELKLSPRRAWQVRLDNGMTLEIGREQVAARIARFLTAYAQTLAPLGLGRRADYVDLRYANGFAVRVPGLAQLKDPAAKPNAPNVPKPRA